MLLERGHWAEMGVTSDGKKSMLLNSSFCASISVLSVYVEELLLSLGRS